LGESARIIKSYESAYPDPLELKQGERVAVEARECEWPGWLWATDKSGRAGWIPETYLTVSGPAGELLRDYDATELDAEAGDTVEILEREGGWARCRKTDGIVGWLPEEVLKIG
jgi:uncharacterized protein YgiM (DUF1202 family)